MLIETLYTIVDGNSGIIKHTKLPLYLANKMLDTTTDRLATDNPPPYKEGYNRVMIEPVHGDCIEYTYVPLLDLGSSINYNTLPIIIYE